MEPIRAFAMIQEENYELYGNCPAAPVLPQL